MENMHSPYIQSKIQHLYIKMNKILTSTALLLTLSIAFACHSTAAPSTDNEVTVIELTAEEFKTKVYDWEQGGDWKYLGNKPAIVDFYATWCGPCRLLKPRLKQIAQEYGDKIVVYSIDAESAPRLSALMGVRAYPTMYFIPMNGIPTQSVGLLSMQDLRRGVNEILLKKANE